MENKTRKIVGYCRMCECPMVECECGRLSNIVCNFCAYCGKKIKGDEK